MCRLRGFSERNPKNFRKKSKKFQEEIPVYPENPDFTP